MLEGLKTKTQKIVASALLAALIFIATSFLSIPSFWGGSGYVHLGDLFIFLACYLVGGWYAAAASALGSCLADIAAGYTQYAFFTLVVKGLMAGAVVLAGGGFKNKIRMGLAFAAGVAVLVSGYFLTDLILNDFKLAIAVANLLPNVIQGAVGAVLAFPVAVLAERAGIFKRAHGKPTEQERGHK